MIIQTGAQHSIKQDSLKAKNSKNDANGSFNDLLSQARERNSEKKLSDSKRQEEPKKNKQDLASREDVNPQTRQDQPARKEAKGEVKQVVREETSSKGPIEGQKEEVTSQAGRTEAMGLKKMNQQEVKGQELSDSLNLSVDQNKTLGKNLKLNENSFEQMMSKMQELNQQALQAGGKDGASVQIQAMPQNLTSSKGQMKIPTDMKLTDGSESLQIQGESLMAPLSGVSEQSAEGAGEEASTQLESLFSQHMAKDTNQSQTGSSIFSEDLANAQNNEGSQKVENMNSIIKQARTFVKDGGGSMEIHLQPEGLGKVQLKVNVENGQVNVEMLADNMAAKKALEEGLFDVKQALESHKLVVDTLKVEMGQDYQKDFSDFQDHAREQANRDFAEQFLGEFRQQRQEKFGGMFDSFRSLQPESNEPELRLNRSNPYSSQGKGRTINMVA